jgi:hypothetical protein
MRIRAVNPSNQESVFAYLDAVPTIMKPLRTHPSANRQIREVGGVLI